MKISSTLDLAKISNKIKKILSPGDAVFLYGQIGVGKTTFARILINTASQPSVTSANLISGDQWVVTTNMYMTIQYNGSATQYWFEAI